MKKISRCQECGRKVYTNDIDLCKRCHQEVGAEVLNNQEVFEEPEENPLLEGLETEASSEESAAGEVQETSEVKEQ